MDLLHHRQHCRHPLQLSPSPSCNLNHFQLGMHKSRRSPLHHHLLRHLLLLFHLRLHPHQHLPLRDPLPLHHFYFVRFSIYSSHPYWAAHYLLVVTMVPLSWVAPSKFPPSLGLSILFGLVYLGLHHLRAIQYH